MSSECSKSVALGVTAIPSIKEAAVYFTSILQQHKEGLGPGIEGKRGREGEREKRGNSFCRVRGLTRRPATRAF